MSQPAGGRQTGSSAGAPAPGRRRSWVGRGARAVLGLFLFAVLLVALFVAFLHTPPGSRAARALVEAWASRALGRPVRMGSLDLRLWKGEASATALSLRLDGTTVDVQRVDVEWSAKAGGHVRLVHPVVVARDTGAPKPEEPASGLAAQPWRALESFGRAELVEGRVELGDAKGQPWLRLGRLDAEMRTQGGRRSLSVRIGDAALGWPDGGLRVKPVSAEGTFSLDGSRLVVERVLVTAEGASLELRGGLERLAPITATAAGKAVVDGALVSALSPGASLSGRIEADTALQATNGAVTGTLNASSPSLTVMGVGPWAVNGRGRLEGPRLVLESLEARGFGGRLVADGPLALASAARTDVRVRAEGLDVPTLFRTLAHPDARVAARADATLRWATTGWDVGAARGEGQVSLRPPAGPPTAPGLPLTGSSRVRIEGRSLALEGASLEAHGASIAADARLAAGKVSGTWSATLPVASINPVLADLGAEGRVPEGCTGQLAAEGDLSGPVSSPEASASVRSEGLAVRGRPYSLEADGRYAAGRIELAPLAIRSGQGRATVTGSLPVLAGAGDWDLRGGAESLELAPVLAALGIAASGPAAGEVRVVGPPGTPAVRARIEARVAAEGSEETAAIAFEGASEGTRMTLERFEADLAGGRVEGSGSYDRASDGFEAKAKASGLEWARLPLLPAAVRRLGGELAGEVSLRGTASHPSGEAHATLGEATLDGSPLPPLALDATADGRRLELLGRAGDTPFLKGGGPLEDDWPVHLEIDAAALPLPAILAALPVARRHEATLAAEGTVAVDVPLRDPKRLRYSAEALRASGKVRSVEWKTEPFRLEGDGDALTLGGLRLSAPRATLAVDGKVALSPSAPFDLALEASAHLDGLDAALPEQRLAGDVALRLQVAGTGAVPEITGEASIDDARGRWEGARWSHLRMRARFLGGEAEIDELSAQLLGGSLSASGRLPLRALGAGGVARLSFEAKDVDLARLLDADLRQEAGATFLVSVDGGIEASAPTIAATRGCGRVVKFESKSPEGTVALDAPAEWRLEDGRLEQDPLRLTGPLGTLEARFEARLAGGPAAGSASISGPFDLRFLSPFVPDTTISGPARIDARASWGEGAVRLDGGLKVSDARMVLEDLAFAVSKLDGEVRFEGDRVAIEATAVSSDGKLHAHGGMRLGPAFFGPADVTLEAERIPINHPEGFRGRATGTIRLAGDPESAYVISGEVALRQGYFTAEFDAGTQSLGRLDWQLAALRGGTIGEMLPLDVDVKLEDPLRIRNSHARLDVLGSLTVSGTLAQPTATGQVSFREGGRLTLSRAEVRVSRGLVELNGYPGGNPEIDLQGATRVGGVGVNVQARGTFDDLDLTLTSPERSDLSQTDLVTLLLTGRTASAAASQGTVIVAEELASALGGVLQKGVGESLMIDVSPDRSLLADDTDPTQRFNVGHRLADNLFVMYSVALDRTEQRWILDFNPGRGRFRFRLIDETDQSLSFEATDRLSFDLWNRGRRTGARRREGDRLAAVRFEGPLPVPEDELRKAAKLRTGRRQGAGQREEAGERVRGELAKKGWRGATVETESVPSGPRSVDLVLRVTPGPHVSFRWSGDPLGRKERRAAEAAWASYASPEVAAGLVAREALVPLRARGHYAAEVVPEVHATGGDVQVDLRVSLGAKGRGVGIEFDGNAALDDRVLEAALPRPGSRAFFEALNGRSSGLTGPLRLAYARAGYVDARVLPPRSEIDAASGKLVVTFPVRERRVSPVAAIELPDEIVAAGASSPRLALRSGLPFDVSAYVADRDAIGAWYRREGWPDARVAGFLQPGPDGVSVRFKAQPGPRPRVGAVRVASDGRVQERIVSRAVTLEPGDLVRPAALAESRERLSELGIFRTVEVRPKAHPGEPDVRDIEVDLATVPDLTLEYGVKYNTKGSGGAGAAPSSPSGGRLQLAGALELTNPLGWGWRVRPYSFLTTKRQTYGLNLDTATLFGLRLRTELLLYDDRDQDPVISSLASHVRGFTFQQTRALRRDLTARRWHDRLRLVWGYTFKHIVYVENATNDLFLAGDRAFLSVSLIGDERDSLADPHHGVFWTATSELSRRGLGSDADYVRLYGQLFGYVGLGPAVWAQGVRLGTVPGTDPLLLIENRFRAGGPTTVRGFEQNALGPLNPEGDSLGGQAVAVLNEELRFPIWKRLQGGVFWDAGNVWRTAGQFRLGDLRQSAGAGLRLMFPFGPIRVEYAWVLGPRPGEPKGRFVFGFGHAF